MIMFIHLYLMTCNYFWMLCEGIYLHTLIVVAVFAEKQHLLWYYLLGWGKNPRPYWVTTFWDGVTACELSWCYLLG